MKPSRHSSRSDGQRGFTLIELMITLVVLAVMVAIATPSFREISLNNRSTSNINNLLADLSMARSEAVKLARTASVAALGGDWNEGWEVFEDTNGNGIRDADEALIRTAQAVNLGYEGNAGFQFVLRGVSGAAAGSDPVPAVTFGPLGQIRTPADGARFALCRPGGDAARSTGIRVDPSGRAQAVRNLAGIGLGC